MYMFGILCIHSIFVHKDLIEQCCNSGMGCSWYS